MKKIKLKKRKNRLLLKRKLVVVSTLVLFFVLGIGYSLLSVNLNILGNITVRKHYGNTLYEVLEKEAAIGTYAKEYTGEHNDSFTVEPSKKIYHWYAPATSEGNTLASEILDKNNVVFANHCWQMIRTTDTGGVKMIYNGEVEDDKCLNTRGNHVGYGQTGTSANNMALGSNDYYGTNYTYDKVNNVFSLSGTVTTGEIKVGQYTCRSNMLLATCSTLYLVYKQNHDGFYYVIPLNGNSSYSEYGKAQFNIEIDSPSYVGYMYNMIYPQKSKVLSYDETALSKSSLNTNYWYAHNAIWGTPTANKYNLENPYQVSSTDDFPNLIGEYTFLNSSQAYVYGTVRYIASVDGSNVYSVILKNGEDLATANYTYTYADSITDNGNGTYTMNNSITIHRSDWYNINRSNIKNKYLCKNVVNNICEDVWYVFDVSTTGFSYEKVANNYKYAKGFTYDDSTNTYILGDESRTFFDINSNKNNLISLHYTCWNYSGECSTISYIFYLYNLEPYYIEITGGKSVEDALNDMLKNDNVNQIDSSAKMAVDAWYRSYLIDYTSELEDVIYCNNRVISSLGGWKPNGGILTTYASELRFKNYNDNTNLNCANITDRFSVSNTKAKLNYPVGLLEKPEGILLNNYYLRGSNYWTNSPYNVGNNYEGTYVGVNQPTSGLRSYYSEGIRPVISLKPGTVYSSGDGSMENPYVIDTN